MRGGMMGIPRSSRLGRALLVAVLVLLAGSCSPYLGLDVGAPFDVDHVTINPNIGIGFPL